MRRIFSFDVDGVIAEGEYLPVMDRVPERYRHLRDIAGAVGTLNEIARQAEVYCISSRSCANATYLTREWMAGMGIQMEAIAGVICNVIPSNKAAMARALFATYHFDDDPRIIASMPDIGVLVHSPNTFGIITDPFPRSVRTWAEIMRYCSLPGPQIAYAPQQSALPFAA